MRVISCCDVSLHAYASCVCVCLLEKLPGEQRGARVHVERGQRAGRADHFHGTQLPSVVDADFTLRATQKLI